MAYSRLILGLLAAYSRLFSDNNKYTFITTSVIQYSNFGLVQYHINLYKWTLSISNTLYLELLSISNNFLYPLDISIDSSLIFSLYLEPP